MPSCRDDSAVPPAPYQEKPSGIPLSRYTERRLALDVIREIVTDYTAKQARLKNQHRAEQRMVNSKYLQS